MLFIVGTMIERRQLIHHVFTVTDCEGGGRHLSSTLWRHVRMFTQLLCETIRKVLEIDVKHLPVSFSIGWSWCIDLFLVLDRADWLENNPIRVFFSNYPKKCNLLQILSNLILRNLNVLATTYYLTNQLPSSISIFLFILNFIIIFVH